ncbi:hypothetical protein [Bacillus sp. B1-b2]|uniref:hypothetical protein n=1 Tax=Bacillus sp. B1-b2 TaxID=2653201 RepID=UPI0009D5C22D|nr:hypothetical protein [Bacillus sp. B1-b2]KAB7663886.1 hypothetical protein F9279_23450 [Bacillus sp. B1-b2]SLL37427.1 Uncharacterised protein [Mycobacteroides abscessus subsp. abscessus]
MPNMVKENGEQCAKQVYQSYEWILIQSKNEKSCWYESLWGECLFYYILELELNTVRYYDQPVEIPIKFFNIELKKCRMESYSRLLSL